MAGAVIYGISLMFVQPALRTLRGALASSSHCELCNGSKYRQIYWRFSIQNFSPGQHGLVVICIGKAMYNNYGYNVLTGRKGKASCYCHHRIPPLTRGCFMHDHVVGLAETPPGLGMDGKANRVRLHSRCFFLSVRKWSGLSAKEMEGLSAVFKTDIQCWG